VTRPVLVGALLTDFDVRVVSKDDDGQPLAVRPMNAYYRDQREVNERVLAEYLASILPDDWVETEVFIHRGMRVDLLSRRETEDGPLWTIWELKVGSLNPAHLAQIRKYMAHMRPILGANRLTGYLLGGGTTGTFRWPHEEEGITVANLWDLMGLAA
jgi:hypothetical protein